VPQFKNLSKINTNRRILLVDDEPYNLLALKIVLQQCGIQNIIQQVDTAYNGQEAIDLVKKGYDEN
jgi:CheY-like chemotaxis protein